ncbi:MAG: alpha-ketoglutarate-dependent dioxygenase AlkB, partial [Cyanobacteria bacterium]|nr:alpha-ketoglutarate-dependent dioxygenase AlkB [Cyanobacteriota bacterium]
NLELAHGDLLLMEPPTQLWWQHALPRRLRLQQERLNLTFRVVRVDR